MTNLVGKTAVVCGSSAGIGKASAVEISKLGANVILVARSEDKLKKVLTELDSSQNQKHSYMLADFSSEKSLNELCESLKSKQVNILFYCFSSSGVSSSGGFACNIEWRPMLLSIIWQNST